MRDMFCFVRDDSCHWYIIRATDRYFWETALANCDYDAMAYLEVQEIDDPCCVEFERYTV